MKFSLALVVAVLTMGIYAAPQGVLSGNTYTVTVPEGNDVTINSDDVALLDGHNTKLVKTGKGRFIMDQNLNTDAAGGGWLGDLEIQQGYILCKVLTTFSRPLGVATASDVTGGTGGKVYISSGATLEFYSDSGTECNYGKSIQFEGDGVDGNGAIYTTKDGGGMAGYGLCASGTFTMTGDAKVGYWGSNGSVRGSFTGPRNGTLNMNGHTLSVRTPNGENSNFKGMNVTNPGHIILAENTYFRLENDAKLNGSSSNTLTLKAGAVWEQRTGSTYSQSKWKLIADGNSTLSFYSCTSGAVGWYGPIQLDADLTLRVYRNLTPTIRDAITGTGKLKLVAGDGNGGTITFKTDLAASKANTFTGGLSIGTNTTFKAAVPAQLPGGPNSISIAAGGHLLVQPTAQGDLAAYTEPALLALSLALGNSPYGSDVQIVGKDGLDWFDSYCFTSAITGPAIFANFLGNDIVVTNASPVADDVNFRYGPGTKNVLATTGSTSGYLEINGGEVEIPSGAAVTLSTRRGYVAGTYPAIGRLTVNGTLNFSTSSSSVSATSLTNSCPAKNRGIVEIGEGGVINGMLGMNRGAIPSLTSQGTYIIKGTVTTPNVETFFGDSRSEYVEIADGGTYTLRSLRTGRDPGSYFNLRIKQGGTMSVPNGNQCGHNFSYNGGVSDILIDGGTYSVKDVAVQLCQDDQNRHNDQARATFTVADNGLARIDYQTYEWCGFNMCDQDNARAMVNLIDGGTLYSSAFNKNQQHGGQLVNHQAIVNFDGGVFGMRNANSYKNIGIFNGFTQNEDEDKDNDHVFIYSKGATISNDVPMTTGIPLEAAYGYGIESIALPSEIANLPAWEYSGAPRVVITDETGYGASACALFDTATGRITGIRVTSRGVDYTAPTVTIKFGGSDNQNRVYTDICTLTENLSDDLPAGTLTKRGSSTLTVDQRCTFSGNTIVAGGTLKLGCDYALASPQIIVKKGGTFDADGHDLMSQVVCELGGSIVGDMELPSALSVSAADLIAGAHSDVSGTLTFPADATIDLDDDNELVPGTKYVLFNYGSASGELPAFTVGGSESEIWKLVKMNGNQLVLMDRNFFLVDGTGEAFTSFANVSNYLENCSLEGTVSISVFGKRQLPSNTKPNGNNAAITKVIFHGGNEGRVDQLDFGYYQRVFPLDVTYRNLKCTYEEANNLASGMRFTPNGHSEMIEGEKTWIIDEPLTADHEFVFDDCLINQAGIAVEISIANAFIISNSTVMADAENQWQAGGQVFSFDNSNPNIEHIRFENNLFDGYNSLALDFNSNFPQKCNMEIVGNTFAGSSVNTYSASTRFAWAKRLIIEGNTFYGKEGKNSTAIAFMAGYLGSSVIVVYDNTFDSSLKACFGVYDASRVPTTFYLGGNTVGDGVSRDRSYYGNAERDIFPVSTTWSDYDDLPYAVDTYANWPDATPFVNAAGDYSDDLADFTDGAEFYAKPGVTPTSAEVPGGYKLVAVPANGRIAWKLELKRPMLLLVK